MRKIVVYIIILCASSACVTYDRTTEQVAETTLQTADSLENALQTYADIVALQYAAETFRAKGQTAKEAKVLYHLGPSRMSPPRPLTEGYRRRTKAPAGTRRFP